MSSTVAPLDTARARKAMVDSQLRTSGVNEEFVLARMLAVPREDFLPEDKLPLAYIDRSVALPSGGALASPLFYGKLLIEAAPMPDDRVLVVSGGTSYLTELIKPLVQNIDEIDADTAAEKAGSRRKTYSLIVIDGAVEHVTDGLSRRLEDSGRIVSGLVLRNVTRLASGRKLGDQLALEPVEDLGIPVLHQFDKPKTWSFP